MYIPEQNKKKINKKTAVEDEWSSFYEDAFPNLIKRNLMRASANICSHVTCNSVNFDCILKL